MAARRITAGLLAGLRECGGLRGGAEWVGRSKLAERQLASRHSAYGHGWSRQRAHIHLSPGVVHFPKTDLRSSVALRLLPLDRA